MFQYLHIEYANPANLRDSITIPYRLREYDVVGRWTKIVQQAQESYAIDDPQRFYSFNSREQETTSVIDRMNVCIDTINSQEHIVDRQLTDINDQDTLNYLHHIFEVYHGLLDQQTHEFWSRAVPRVRTALADLNLLVHECEDLIRHAKPRHVVTWYGLPKTNFLDIADYQYFTNAYEYGTVYLNYAEIGKTLEALAQDNDEYIAPEAFQPFRHYSADFFVEFFTRTQEQVREKCSIINNYYTKQYQFFQDRGLYREHPYLRPGSIPLADIEFAGDAVEAIRSRQYVKSVSFT